MRIFLDIDGVLNNHKRYPNGYCGINPLMAAIFDLLPYKELIISSAWRYLVINKHMTLVGFENMLLTHGLNCLGKVKGITRADKWPTEPREDQINDYIKEHNLTEYVILDDLDLKLQHFFKINNGITREDVQKIKMFYKKEQ